MSQRNGVVRDAVDATRAQGTAALRFVPAEIRVEPSLEARLTERWPNLGGPLDAAQGFVRNLRERLEVSEIQGPVGRIDFAHDRSVCTKGKNNGWMLTAPGVEFVGDPGEWERDVLDDDTLGDQEPFWLLELIAAATDANDEGAEPVLGVPCRKYKVVSSLSVAASQAKRPIGPPLSRRPLDVEHLRIDVWLDHGGLIRRAIFYGNQLRMLLELSDFGAPPPIDLPGPDEIVEYGP